MYEAYWGLNGAPFENGSDPRFYYTSEGHQGALLKLRYTVESGKGAALVTADRGAGKTLLVEMLRRQLSDTYTPFVHLVFPQMSPSELLAYLAAELSGSDLPSGRGADTSVRAIQQALASHRAKQKHAIVALDEAHLIEDPACWEMLRLLMNFETNGRADLTLLLIGQMPLLTAIDRMPSWEERLAVKCVLKPLTLDETACYVQHRLQTVGCQRELFQPEAITALYRLTHGFPRRINRLADLALVVGYAEQLPVIGPEEVDAISHELIALPTAE